MIYLLHYEDVIGDPQNPRGQAQHYMGYADDGRLEERIEEHRRGQGAAITRAFAERGIAFVVAACWPGDRSKERRLKRWHKHRQLCPICRQQAMRGESEYVQLHP